MEETYRLLIEFKTIHPLRFWTAIFITISSIIFAIWRLSGKKQETKTEPLANQKTTSTIIVKKETDKPKHETNKEKTTLEKPTKVYTFKSVKTDLEVNEPKPIYTKPTKPKQEKLTSKIEPFEVKPEAKPKLEEHLPLAKVETTKSKDEVVFVDYDFLKTETINSYPVCRFPQKGTVIRSYRFGNTKRRGFKEESFQKSIEKHFGKEFSILGNVRLNTGKETRPFEPDIAIIHNSSFNNVRINIEIDEPYAGITRQPTHCKGDDINRDIYFVDRGWIVIRFSEYQVHTQENDCLLYIAQTIKSAIPKYIIPSQLVNQTNIQTEKLWDIVQAQKWEKAKYREQYLNHTFLITEEQAETIERDFNEQEIKEEQLVKPTLIGEVDNKKSISFNFKNSHSRDNRIKFYPEPHIYTIDNTPAPSASTVISKFFPEFDSEYWSNRKAPELGMTANEVALMWRNKGEKAAQEGTFLHEQIENFYLDQEYNRTEEFHLFENFVNENNHIKPYRTEWRIFDEQHHIAGTIDLISENVNGYEMYDWKRSKKVVNPFNGEPIENNKWQKGIGQLSDIDDTSYNRYCLQQSLYKYILEKNYGIKVSNMYLIVLYPDYEKYFKVEVPYLKDKAEYILRTL